MRGRSMRHLLLLVARRWLFLLAATVLRFWGKVLGEKGQLGLVGAGAGAGFENIPCTTCSRLPRGGGNISRDTFYLLVVRPIPSERK